MFLPASDDNAGVDGLAVGTWWGGPGLFVDFTKQSTREHWKQYIKDALLRYGCRLLWNDNCEYDSMVDKDAKVYFEGKGQHHRHHEAGDEQPDVPAFQRSH